MTSTPILQFGTSRFLQAHADLFLSQGPAALGPVTVVQSSGDPARRARLAALTRGFPVRIEGLAEGRVLRHEVRVRSVARALATDRDWPEIARIAVEEAVIVLSNTADAGWRPMPADGAPDFRQDMSYPAKLTHLMLARWRAGGRPLQVMPTELLPRNGDRLRARVLDLAAGLDAGFASWVAAQVFANSLVDRIVSEALEPAGAVAEPYALWAIEDRPGLILPCRHPALRVVPDLVPVERLKLHILNLGHTWMVARWLAAGGRGAPLVREMLAGARAELADLYAREVVPVFAAAGQGAEAAAYAAATLERFANPFLAHSLADIARDHAEKVARRIGAFLDWAGALGLGGRQPRLAAIAGR